MPPRRRRRFGRNTGPLTRRKAIIGRQMNPRLQRELRRANHLMNNGEHQNAAKIFLSLAQRAQDRGILGPAAMMFLQAAHAFLLAGAAEATLIQGSNGIKLLAAEKLWTAMQNEGERLAKAFEREGHKGESQQISKLIGAHLSDPELLPLSEAGTDKQLPEKCPYCGASMSLEQVTSAQAAECKYCGSIVLPSQMS